MTSEQIERAKCLLVRLEGTTMTYPEIERAELLQVAVKEVERLQRCNAELHAQRADAVDRVER